ncbi:cysteine hydrolase family protein [Streptococcus suis]|uniref:cysteine hydrolase family protein n=1 Tax=Streptococcus TaxID=1301 RepID=UPI000CF5AC2E|nr:cysteine hydrolase family protein [Streptococcus suis]MCL4923474.1 cysteine hydrolase [Streptococcus suis]HEM2813513.1 cysteine hydrolase [Streptococcus suis]HEM5145939.1 cysteine hydrolase [Streptococcus suis]HEM6578133.1 cysteine hydrolase [Streptococcus suis]HEM6589453.1 cysteine hydrolase [Streptococcus suis]
MKSALLVIDIQHLPVEGKPYGIENRLRLWQDSLAQARQAGLEVIHVRHHDQEFVKGTADWEIHSTVAPLASEKIFDKTFNSAFKETGLHAYLQEKGIERLIVMGMSTNFCIDTTIKVAFELGYTVAVIKDGTTTPYTADLPANDLIGQYETIWSWSFAQVDTLENIIRG